MAQLPITENPQFAATMEPITAQDRGEPGTFNPKYQVLLDNDNYLLKKMNAATRIIYVTLPASGWSSLPPYRQNVAAKGITADDNPVLVKAITLGYHDEALSKAYNEAFGMIDVGETEDGFVTFWCCSKKPTIDFMVGLKGV